MTLTLELPAEIEQALTSRAQARGLALPEYLQQLMAHAVENKETLPKLPPTPEAIARREKRQEKEQRQEEKRQERAEQLRPWAEAEADKALVVEEHERAEFERSPKGVAQRESFKRSAEKMGTKERLAQMPPEERARLDKRNADEAEKQRHLHRKNIINTIVRLQMEEEYEASHPQSTSKRRRRFATPLLTPIPRSFVLTPPPPSLSSPLKKHRAPDVEIEVEAVST